MPQEMRFCRACGNRLGDGPAEYTETVRLPNAKGAAGPAPFYPSVNAPLSRQTESAFPRRRRLGFSGMTWLWIVLGVFFASGGLISALNGGRVPRPTASSPAPRSFFGVDELQDADGGATFADVAPPGSPADKAVLVGGDIVTSFDGHQVTGGDQMMELLRQTPIGKTVAVIYTRDGLTQTTQLTTVSEAEYNRLRDVFSRRPEGRGKFGFESRRTTVMRDPQGKVYGVRIDWVEPNGPADLFGIKPGDIILDFDKVPIRTSEELLERVYRALPRSSIDIGLMRDGQPLKIPVTMGRN
jgi:S1-C subfamily serine protease